MNRRAAAVLIAFTLVMGGQMLPVSLGATPTVAKPQQAVGLLLTLSPPKLPSDGGVYPTAVVSVVDAKGLPSVALNSTIVYLTSSQTDIATVPQTVTINAGSTYVVANITTTTIPGSATITASSTGLSAASSSLTTVYPSGFPSRLEVFASPDKLLQRSSDTGTVRVELVDAAGLPSKAITAVNVSLSSSNESIANLNQDTLTISEGSFYASGTFATTTNNGTAVITATSTGFLSGSTPVTVLRASNGSPNSIYLRLVPEALPADGLSYDALEVGLMNSSGPSGMPAVSSVDTTVLLTSSKPEVVSVTDFVTIPAGKISTLVFLTTSALPGSVNITGSSPGLLIDTASVKTVIPAPSKLQVYVSPPATSATPSNNLPILGIQLQDSAGNPARARQPTMVVVTSSNGTLLSSPISLTLPTGSDYTFAQVSATGVGKTVLTASSQGLGSSQVTMLLDPSPLVVSLTTATSTIFSNQSVAMTFSGTLLGKPLSGLNVTWGSTSGFTQPSTAITNAQGSTTVFFHPGAVGRVNITAIASSNATGTIRETYSLLVVQPPPKQPLTVAQTLLKYWYFIVAPIVVAVIAVGLLLRMRRKKQRAQIEAGFEAV